MKVKFCVFRTRMHSGDERHLAFIGVDVWNCSTFTSKPMGNLNIKRGFVSLSLAILEAYTGERYRDVVDQKTYNDM